MIILSPSILAADFSCLGESVARVEQAGATHMHIDVMDGHFVPNITFGVPIIKSLRKTSKAVFDVHLMIDDPERYAEDFIAAGADIVTFHVNAPCDIEKTIDKIHALGAQAGLAVNPDIPVELMHPYRGKIEQVLIMSVYAGFGGQSYIEDVNTKIREARYYFGPDIRVEVDGGINLQNKHIPVSHGADMLVAGTAVFGAKDPQSVVSRFLEE